VDSIAENQEIGQTADNGRSARSIVSIKKQITEPETAKRIGDETVKESYRETKDTFAETAHAMAED
jgi:hypothetical protein